MNGDAIRKFCVEIDSLCKLPPAELRHDARLQSWRDISYEERDALLVALSRSARSPLKALHLLHTVLSEFQGPWPPSLVRHHAAIMCRLRGSSAESRDSDITWLILGTDELVKKSFKSLSDLLYATERPVFQAANGRVILRHNELKRFIDGFALPVTRTDTKPVVAISISDGSLFSAACVSVATFYTAVLLDPMASQEQLQNDLTRAGATHFLTTIDDLQSNGPPEGWLKQNDIDMFTINIIQRELILRNESGNCIPESAKTSAPNLASDIAIQFVASKQWNTRFFTSLTIQDVLSDAFTATDAWGLSESDICLGFGLIQHRKYVSKTVFAPILSGGSLVCGSSSTPDSFWRLGYDVNPTWLVATPEIHKKILSKAPSHSDALVRHRIRLVCSVGGVDKLNPKLETLIKDTFQCEVASLQSSLKTQPSLRKKRPSEASAGTSQIVTYIDPSHPHFSQSPTSARRSSNFRDPWEGRATRSASVCTTTSDAPLLEHDFNDPFEGVTSPKSSRRHHSVSIQQDGIRKGSAIIKPFEIEQAILSAANLEGSPLIGRVTDALVFPIPHDTLGQDVAVVLVSPQKSLRADVRALHAALRLTSLQQTKWPSTIVYMDGLPQIEGPHSYANLSQRLGLTPVCDQTLFAKRHWEAATEPDSGPWANIIAKYCDMQLQQVQEAVQMVIPDSSRAHVVERSEDGMLELYIAPRTPDSKALELSWARHIESYIALSLHDYSIPAKIHLLPEPFPETEEGEVEEQGLARKVARLDEVPETEPLEPTHDIVRESFASALDCEPEDISDDVNFLDMGGNLVKAEHLLSIVRSHFQIDIPPNLITNEGTVNSISTFVDTELRKQNRIDAMEGCTETRSSTNVPLLLMQLIPLAIFFPTRTALQWVAQLWILSRTKFWEDTESLFGRLANLGLSMAGSWLLIQAVFPFIGIASKWLIIWRYREGLYPMWGAYHTRWWLVQKFISLSGMGIFELNDYTKAWYYCLMGARIGKNVQFRGADVGEFDLLQLCDGVRLEHCVCRPFASEGNTSMYLGRIYMGKNSSAGPLSVIAPGTDVLPNVDIGINSSSWEQEDAEDLKDDFGLQNSIPEPHWLLTVLLTWPLWILGWLLSFIPWVAGIYGMIFETPEPSAVPFRVILNWFQASPGVAFQYVAVMLQAAFSTLVMYIFAIAVRKALDLALGNATENFRRGEGHFRIWRATLMRTLFSQHYLHELNELIGLNHKVRSEVLRKLGANIGKQVCWPMRGPWITDYHLLKIGNNVTLGSECHLMTDDGVGSGIITIRDGANIGDHVCLLPGVDIGERTNIGFGALTRRNKQYRSDATYVGCRRGDAVCTLNSFDEADDDRSELVPLSPTRRNPHRGRQESEASDDTLIDDGEGGESYVLKERKSSLANEEDLPDAHHRHHHNDVHGSSHGHGHHHHQRDHNHRYPHLHRPHKSQDDSPFSRAFYHKKAPYHVWSPAATLTFSALMTLFSAFYWSVPAMSGMKLSARIWHDYGKDSVDPKFDVIIVFPLTALAMCVLHVVFAIGAVGIVAVAKWWILGRIKPGSYDWDKSSYCQRWQLLLAIEKVMERCFVDRGLLSLLTGTHWLVWYYRLLGAKIGKDCALYASGSPSLALTKPDLISIGDRVAIDNVGIIAHYDVRGKFSMDRIRIGNRCVLRSGSSIMSGAVMKDDSCLLEHTLITPNTVVEEKWVMQRRPAERFYSKRIKKSDKFGANIDKKLSF